MSNENNQMSAADVLAVTQRCEGLIRTTGNHGLADKAAVDFGILDLRQARVAVAAMIARVDALESELAGAYARVENAEAWREALQAKWDSLEAENRALRSAYHKARNAAAGFSNYCEESASSRRCERELAEAERMFRDIDAARAEADHG